MCCCMKSESDSTASNGSDETVITGRCCQSYSLSDRCKFSRSNMPQTAISRFSRHGKGCQNDDVTLFRDDSAKNFLTTGFFWTCEKCNRIVLTLFNQYRIRDLISEPAMMDNPSVVAPVSEKAGLNYKLYCFCASHFAVKPLHPYPAHSHWHSLSPRLARRSRAVFLNLFLHHTRIFWHASRAETVPWKVQGVQLMPFWDYFVCLFPENFSKKNC